MPLNYPEVNEPETTIILEFSDFFIHQTIPPKSPVDQFYHVCSESVKLTKPEIINDNPIITRLLLLSYVSAVEEYIRSIFCSVINICPFIREKAYDKVIKFGSIDYYKADRLPEGIFESKSFASLEEIKRGTNDYLGIDIKNTSALYLALDKFDKVCNLRHCAIHCGGVLNAHNAKQLKLGKDYINCRLEPNATILQDTLGICYSFVRSYNQTVLKNIIDNWVAKAKLTGVWKKDKKDFSKLINIFWSSKDNLGEPNYGMLYRQIGLPRRTIS